MKAILSRYPAPSRPMSTPEPLGNAGGASGARLWRFTSGSGPLVLRAWPVDGPTIEALERIHAWLARADPLGFVPVPLPDLSGRTIQQAAGRLWELAPWRPGGPDLGSPPSPRRIEAGFAGLAAFHVRLGGDALPGPSPGLAARRAEIEDWLGGELDRMGEAVGRSGLDPLRAEALAWLAEARRLAPALLEPAQAAAGKVVPLQPCLRDARPDHFLFEGDRLTGLVDFGAMGIETVAGDLARLLLEWVGPDRVGRSAALAAYEAIRPLSPPEAALIAPFEATASLLGGGRWVRWHFLEGRVFDDPAAAASGLRRARQRIASLAASRDLRP